MNSAKSRRRRWGELVALSAIALAQPVLWLIGENSVFLVAHGLSRWAVLLFGLVIVLVPMVLTIGLDELVATAAPGAYGIIGAVLRGFLLAAIFLPSLFNAIETGLIWSIVILVGSVSAATLAWRRWAWLRSTTGFLWVAPIVFLAWFVFISDARALAFPPKAGSASVTGTSDISVVWIVFDQLPLSILLDEEGNIAAERFPNFARLAERSTWFPRATTIASSTALAVPAALTGRIPEPDGLPVVSQNPQNLFTMLANTHHVHAWETFTQLCPDAVCLDEEDQAPSPPLALDTLVIAGHVILGEALASGWLPAIDAGWGDFSRPVDPTIAGEAASLEEVAAKRVRGDDRAQTAAFLESIERSDDVALHYLHIEKPHEPLMFLPDGRTFEYCVCYSVDEDNRWPNDGMTEQRLQHYLLQTMYVDTVLGKTLDKIEMSEQASRTLLVVMSDHGVSLLPGSVNREVEPANADDILPVPVFISEPGQAVGKVDSRSVQITSILPTVLDILGLEPPDDALDGVSLRTDLTPPTPEVIVSDSRVEMGVPLPDPRNSSLIAWRDGLSPVPVNPYAWGAGAALFGEAVADMTVSPSTLDLALESTLVPRQVDTSAMAPVHVFGELAGAESEVDLVVAVDGVIAGSGTSFFYERWRVSLIVNPELLGDGPGDLRVFQLDGQVLREVTVRSVVTSEG